MTIFIYTYNLKPYTCHKCIDEFMWKLHSDIGMNETDSLSTSRVKPLAIASYLRSDIPASLKPVLNAIRSTCIDPHPWSSDIYHLQTPYLMNLNYPW